MRRQRIRVGIIGLGFGLHHIREFQRCADVEVAVVCSRTRDTATKVAREFDIPAAVTDYRDMLAMDELDGVCVCTPVYLHHRMTLDAIAAGKHVLCEKPLALDRAQAREMHARAEDAGIVHMTNFGWRFNAPAFRAKALLEDGYLGRLYHVNARYMMGYRADPSISFGWRDRRAEAGMGALGDLGVHLIDMVRWWTGEFTRVCADTRTLIETRAAPKGAERQMSETDDSCVFIAELNNGAQGVFHASRCAIRSDYIHIDLHGSNGTLVFEFERGTMQAKLRGAQGLHEELLERSMSGQPYIPSPQQHFVNGIRAKKPAQPTFYAGLRVQEVADAIVQSADQGVWVMVASE